MNDREVTKLAKAGIDSINKLAASIEKLVDEPMVEMEPSPPQCPNCRDINPIIRLEKADAMEGPLLEFLLSATCSKCSHDFYIVFTGWAIFTTRQEAVMNAQILVEGLTGKKNV